MMLLELWLSLSIAEDISVKAVVGFWKKKINRIAVKEGQKGEGDWEFKTDTYTLLYLK